LVLTKGVFMNFFQAFGALLGGFWFLILGLSLALTPPLMIWTHRNELLAWVKGLRNKKAENTSS
jgi:hypothetical protein